MQDFEPIAIVGQAAILPGALTPSALWELVHEGRDLISTVPADRWGLAPETALTDDPDHAADRAWSDRGGYVRGFEALLDKTLRDDPFQTLDAERVRALDPLFQWVLYAGREALRDAGHTGSTERVGAIFGNLSFPSSAMSRFAEGTWLANTPGLANGQASAVAGIPTIDPDNRYMSGLPAHLLAQELGLGAGAFALDAACASSLYAIKLACDKLHDRTADMMLAGAVCRSDDLFIHVGFCALKAMSQTGQSRPFHADADGLVPGEGCAFVTLKRLRDAIEQGDEILGVIRGVGLSNDGRGRGLLAPNADGQVRAMEQAYRGSGLTAADVQYVECHATGTTVGDATELRSMTRVFGPHHQSLPIGSLKGNLGHLITAAGASGLIKVLGAMKAGLMPPTLHLDVPNPVLAETPFRPVTAPEAWESDGPRIAAVSAFGFGGNNAHVLVESYDGPERYDDAPVATPVTGDIALVSMGVTAGDADRLTGFREALFSGRTVSPTAGEIDLPLRGMRFPPNDLKQSLPQQLLILRAALEAIAPIGPLDTIRTGVFIGSQSDPEVCRYGARWRLRDWAPLWAAKSGNAVDPMWLEGAMDQVVPVLQSAGVVGNMPNIPANRINSQFDFGGPGFTVSSEELSGLTALRIGLRMLRSGELDTALVGAVDLCDEAVHRAAAHRLPQDRQSPGDAAVVLVLRRVEDAVRNGESVIATFSESDTAELSFGPTGIHLASRFGHAHAASALLHVAAAALSVRDGKRPEDTGPASPWATGHRTARVQFDALGGATDSIIVSQVRPGISVNTHDQRVPASGPSFTAPAHPPVVRLTPMPNGPRFDKMQPMAPAPSLPSAMTDAPAMLAGPTGFDGREPAPAPAKTPGRPAPTGPTHTHTTPALAPRTVPTRPILPQPPTPAPMVATPSALAAAPSPMTGFHAQLAAVHAAHMTQQAEVHQRFLAMRATTADQLIHAYQARAGLPRGSSPTPAPLPVARPVQPLPPPAPTAISRPVAPGAPMAPKAPPIAAPKAIAKPPEKKPAKTATPSKGMNFDAIVHPPADLPGPKYDRAQLETLSSDKISKVFPEMFHIQDDFPRQVRMPEPPLLLATRVTGIDAEPGSMTTGTIWTETDVVWDDWFLHDGHMPAGIMIESGQADLLLISWLGADFHNKGERVYRLLGCELTYHGGLPRPGDTLKYDIHVDGHANQGNTRIFFFHYDCRVDGGLRLAVREGQAGFFSDEELANSGGIIWTPEGADIVDNPRLDPPVIPCTKTAFTQAEVEAFSNGDGYTCFGEGFEYLQAHVRTPRISPAPMLFFDEVTDCAPGTGPWKRGYFRAVANISPDDWFFDGHFKDDPCMPGTLMFEGCLQAVSFYMTSLGVTVNKDGWRFEPVQDTAYPLRCRGQVTPTSKVVVYEIFVEEVILTDGKPTIWADFLCTVDGLKAFHAQRVGIELTPDWPINSRPEWLESFVEPKAVAKTPEGFEFGYKSLMACAWGKPSDAFGPMYTVFDQGRHCARLPGPPYHFMSRLVRIDGKVGDYHFTNAKAAVGTEIELEYDVPEDSWYFDQNGNRTMPFAVLLEAALQPCGWIACYIGSALTTDKDLFFRNLDGTGTLTAEIWPNSGTLRTVATITSISNAGGMIIQSFDVTCFIGETPIYSLKTVFGFFPTDALANQVGITPTAEDRAVLAAPCDYLVDLTDRPGKYCEGSLRLPKPMLLMLDRVTGFWPTGGKKGLGKLRSEKDVNPAEWFFKAHFYSDPVQPGSLGIEAMIQLLQFYMLETDMGAGMANPRFEPLQLGNPMKWSYRGQVVPRNKVIYCEIDIVEVGEDDSGRFAVCDAYLWVDDLRIYSSTGMGMRIVDGGVAGQTMGQGKSDYPFETPHETRSTAADAASETLLDPKGWVADHQPTWTVPALPAMSMVDRLAGEALKASPGKVVSGLRDVAVKRWIPVPGPTETRVSIGASTALDCEATLEVWREALNVDLSRFEPACSGIVSLSDTYADAPSAWETPTGGTEVSDPYASGSLFHGPAFRYLKTLTRGNGWSLANLDASAGSVPRGTLGQGLLDALTHGVPHDAMHTWSDAIPQDHAAYPWRIQRLDLFGALPSRGQVTVHARFADMASEREPRVEIQATVKGRVIAELVLVEILLPKGPIGSASPERRLAFLRDGSPSDGLGLSTTTGKKTSVDAATIKGSDWLPGTVASVYGLSEAATPEVIASKDHLARIAGVHPSAVNVNTTHGWIAERPMNRWPLTVAKSGNKATVSSGDLSLNLSQISTHWDAYFQAGRWPAEDIYYQLIKRFIGQVHLQNAAAFNAAQGRSMLYVANHQVAVESLLFSMIASGLSGVNTVTLAKMEHQTTWLGKLIAHCFSYPGVSDPEVITFFDRTNRRSLPGIIQRFGEEMVSPGKSILVHVEGTRSLACRTPVNVMGAAFIDMAIRANALVVPVRFMGALPVAPLESRIEFPTGMGKQDVWIGTPMQPEDLSELPLRERKTTVLNALNTLGPPKAEEVPSAPDPAFAKRVQARMKATGADHEHATLYTVLQEVESPTEPIARLVKATKNAPLKLDNNDSDDWLGELARRLAVPTA
jgi:3-oxoacyl-(acyl-carrier-protein) synthase/3-hydroxymyristoyl/3-hydroxydecanoyl-(acyl carrier protein) dehydratase/1-acyl-sn-glycerol-3-phosphate acyltransferase